MNDVSKKTIWYCHHYAGSPKLGMSYRPFHITKAFNQLGHNGFVIRASFHHLLRQAAPPQREGISCYEEEGVPVVCIKARYYRGNGLGRLLNSLDYALGIKKYYQSIIDKTGKPEVIIVSSAHPFHFKFLYKLSRKLGAKLIFEVRDLWPLSLQELLGVNQWHPMSIWLSHIEKKAYKHSDYVVSLLDKALPYMQPRGLSPERFIHIPNGVAVLSNDRVQSALNPKLKQQIEKLRGKKKILLGYAGAMGKPNALESLIKALKLLQDNHIKLHCILVGDGGLKQELVQYADSLKLENVTFMDPILKAEVNLFLAQMDVLYLGWNNSPLYQYGVSPNKLFDYMLAKKPIVESGGAPRSIIDEAGCGIRCKAESPKAISETLETMVRLTDDQRKQMGQKAYHMVTENFDYHKLACDYQKVFN